MQQSLSTYSEECQELLWEKGFPYRWLKDRGLFDGTIRKYELGWDESRKAIVIPYLNARGETRRVRYRNFEGSTKYIWGDGEKGAHLFHVKATRKPRVWLTEGEFDAMILDQSGFTSVAVPGAKLFKPEWRYLFSYCQRLTVVFDADSAGIEGAQRLAGLLGPVVADYRQVKLPEGMDVTDLYLEDRAKLEALVR